MIFVKILFLSCVFHGLRGESCNCPFGYTLVCDKTVALSLAQPCATQCVDFVKPTHEDLSEKNPCSVREEVLSASRPSFLVDIAYHPCYCLDEKHYQPVCNTHFVTYLNECTMNCIKPGSIKSDDGPCVSRNTALSCVSCYRNSHPVCATDGKTYPNDCMFQCFKTENNILDITIAHDGACLPEDSPYQTQTLQKRSGKKTSAVKRPSLEVWLLSMVDFDRQKTNNVRKRRVIL